MTGKLIELQGGAIEVASEPGKGSTFTVTLPRASERLLIVDDNPTNLKLASEVLEFEGHTVLKARDAEEAQQVLLRHIPELILMDIALPDMDGRTKADERTRRVPLAALTAFAMKGDDGKALQAGCDGYITKSIDTRRLPEQVAIWLNGRR